MRFYTGRHRYYCGIDLHARTMYLCALENIPFVLGHALYEIHDIGRFKRVQDFSSYARLVKSQKTSAGKGKALSILAARLGRASYYMLRRNVAFDMDRFMN